MLRRWLAALVVVIGLTAAGAAVLWSQLPGVGAGGLLHPSRRPMTATAPPTCVDSTLDGAGVTISRWRCRQAGNARETIVYLHGIADTRAGAGGVVQSFGSHGFDVIAYDSRAHGNSGGDTCTYGFFEKQDLRRLIDQAARGPVVLIGTSLGAAVALQEAGRRSARPRRAPRFFTRGVIDRAFALAEQEGHLQVDVVSPADAAPRITAAVLLLHGDADHETPLHHSRRIFAALSGTKRLIIVPGAGHNGCCGARSGPISSVGERMPEDHDPGTGTRDSADSPRHVETRRSRSVQNARRRSGAGVPPAEVPSPARCD